MSIGGHIEVMDKPDVAMLSLKCSAEAGFQFFHRPRGREAPLHG